MASNITELSADRRALLEKYLRGDRPQITTSVNTIPRRSQSGPAPLSFGQQQLWLLAQLMPDTPVYNECVTIHIPGPLDAAILEQSLNEIIRRHEAWRTSFPIVDGQPVQITHSTLTLTLPVVDLRHLPATERETEALRLATEEGKLPFDLVNGPLLRATLMRLGDEETRLYLALHHIIFDGFTIYQVLLPELHALYKAFSAGQPSPLSPLPIQYADFATWQRDWLQGQVLADQLTYWKPQLAGAPTALALPADRPRPQVPTYHGSIQRFTLPGRLIGALRDLCSQEASTLYMALTTAFNILLYRYMGQDDILIGTAAAGRKRPEVQGLMGVFMNTLVMRTDLTGNPSFRELLRRVREVTLAAQAHEDMPFEYLVKELQPQREPGQNPLFQVLLMLEPPQPALPSGWTVTHTDIHPGVSKFDLSIIIEDRVESFLGYFEYSTDLFEAETIARMIGHWQTLLEGIVANPDQRLSELPILTERERHQLLVAWNATSTEFPSEQCVHQLFEAQVERTPDSAALIFEDQQLTYRELNERANQLARYLQQLGVGPEVMVGLCMERSLEMIVSLLAILKAGGAYVPLDLAYPTERLAYMLQDTQAPVVLTLEKFVDVLPGQHTRLVCLDTVWERVAQESIENVVSGVTAENLAYVMYTSGSTGKPKGTEIRHSSINRLVFGVDYARLDSTQTILHMAPISFDASTLEVWGALLHGGQCVLFPERVPTPKSIGAAIHKYNVTTLWLTASLFNAVVDEAPDALVGAGQVLTGGEALSVVHIRRALEWLSHTRLINGYGPHESTTFACCYSIPKQLGESVRSIPIGRPIGNTQVYILDQHLNPVPIGVPGELYIGGPGLARGYLNQPQLTAEKFIVHPFSDDPEARLYKTGDLVRYLPDGNIEFLGRLDQQVKIRGFRIELGEIETILGHHPAVREAVVLVYTNERHEKHLVAYVVPFSEQHAPLDGLRHFLKEQLPEYMIPSHIMLLDSIPRTANGKVDRHGLPVPQRASQDSFVAPTSPVQHQLVQIWEDLLNVQPIGIRDNFFALGGHSLLAARMIDRIEQSFGKKLPLATLYAGATIEHLAHLLAREEEIGNQPVTHPCAPVVTVQSGGTGRPLFYLHGDWSGSSFYCLELARSLGAEQPFYILETYKFGGTQPPPTFEEMAAAHVASLRAVQPKGPYLLAGFCNGGLVAYEIARQLQAVGEKVDLLVLIDPATPLRYRRLRNFISLLGSLAGLNQAKQLDCFLMLHRYPLEQWHRLVKKLRRLYYWKELKDMPEQVPVVQQRVPPPQENKKSVLQKLASINLTPAFLRQQWKGMYEWVSSNYRPGAYSGRVTLLLAREEFFNDTKWCRAMGVTEVEVHTIAGSHRTCRGKHINDFAENLRLLIRFAASLTSGSARG